MPEPKDIDELRRELEASQLRANGVLETAVNAIITINERGIIETVNAATERMFGYAREEMIGRNVSMLMPAPYREQHDGYLEHYRNTGERKIIGIGREVTARRKDGSVFFIDLAVGEVLLPGGRIFTGIIRDLTERKLLEEKLLSISEDEQARIGQDIHDDLCQQLAAIGCLAKVAHRQLSAGESPVAPQLDEIARLLATANSRAREMSRGLLPVVHDAAALMDSLEDLAESTARIFRVPCHFHCEVPVSIPENKLATQLFRIAQEAVTNAVKHSNASRIDVMLRRGAGLIHLSIADDGRGIHDASPEKSRGLGLLTMTQRARMIGGTITVRAAPTGGTLVHCTLPSPE